jgi:prevent-host-death family protein
MSAVSVREFSYNPSAVFVRVERGEAIEVTRHGKTIAVVVPGSGVLARYAPLIARGIIRIKPTTTTICAICALPGALQDMFRWCPECYRARESRELDLGLSGGYDGRDAE